MDDGYDTCPYCRWAGKLRADGTMRKHRVARDSGHIGSTGSFMQDPHGPICKGTGIEPWKVGDQADAVVLNPNGLGGFTRPATADERRH